MHAKAAPDLRISKSARDAAGAVLPQQYTIAHKQLRRCDVIMSCYRRRTRQCCACGYQHTCNAQQPVFKVQIQSPKGTHVTIQPWPCTVTLFPQQRRCRNLVPSETKPGARGCAFGTGGDGSGLGCGATPPPAGEVMAGNGKKRASHRPRRNRPTLCRSSSAVGGRRGKGSAPSRCCCTCARSVLVLPKRPFEAMKCCRVRSVKVRRIAICKCETDSNSSETPSACVAWEMSCAACSSRFNGAKTCVSSGCNGHVNLAGKTNKMMRSRATHAMTSAAKCCDAASRKTRTWQPGRHLCRRCPKIVRMDFICCVDTPPA